MGLPRNLILVRHGHSEGNLAGESSKKGDNSLFTPDYRERLGHQWRLTTEGQKQAKLAGKWIKQNIATKFDKYYVSPYLRTRETAALLDLTGALWRMDQKLRERDWGDIEGIPRTEFEKLYPLRANRKQADALYTRLPGGESIADVVDRVRTFFNTLYRDCPEEDVVVVTHGEFMWAFRYLMERMTDEEWVLADKDPVQKIYNTQIFHYSRVHPKTQKVGEKVDWFRSVAPSQNIDHGWVKINRRKFTNNDLLIQIQKVKPLFPDS